jgi:hypothetical protein
MRREREPEHLRLALILYRKALAAGLTPDEAEKQTFWALMSDGTPKYLASAQAVEARQYDDLGRRTLKAPPAR